MVIVNVPITVVGRYDHDGDDARHSHDVEDDADYGPDQVLPDDWQNSGKCCKKIPFYFKSDRPML